MLSINYFFVNSLHARTFIIFVNVANSSLYILLYKTNMQVYTISFIVLEHDLNTVDVVHSSKIHHPPNGLVWSSWILAYYICPHTCCYIPVHCVFSFKSVRWFQGCRILSGDFVCWQIIYRYDNASIIGHIFPFVNLLLELKSLIIRLIN